MTENSPPIENLKVDDDISDSQSDKTSPNKNGVNEENIETPVEPKCEATIPLPPGAPPPPPMPSLDQEAVRSVIQKLVLGHSSVHLLQGLNEAVSAPHQCKLYSSPFFVLRF